MNKFGGGKLILWPCFSAAGPGRIHIQKENVNAGGYLQILSNNLFDSERDLQMRPNYTFQHYQATPHTAFCLKERLSDNQIDVLPWAAGSYD